MVTDLLYAGIDISLGRKPFTYAALDLGLNLLALEKYNLPDILELLEQKQVALVAINVPSVARKSSATRTKIQAIHSDFHRILAKAGYRPFSQDTSKRWFEANAHAPTYRLAHPHPRWEICDLRPW